MGVYPTPQTDMYLSLTLLLCVCISVISTQYIDVVCQCNGEGNGSRGEHPPCSTRYGEGLDESWGVVSDGGKLDRWCYVDENTCCTAKKSSRTGRWWDYHACYETGVNPDQQYDTTATVEGEKVACVSPADGDTVRETYGGGGSGGWSRTRGGRWRQG